MPRAGSSLPTRDCGSIDPLTIVNLSRRFLAVPALNPGSGSLLQTELEINVRPIVQRDPVVVGQARRQALRAHIEDSLLRG